MMTASASGFVILSGEREERLVEWTHRTKITAKGVHIFAEGKSGGRNVGVFERDRDRDRDRARVHSSPAMYDSR